MKFQSDQPNVKSYCGIIDVYHGDVTSYSMCDLHIVNVKYRIGGDVAFEHEIPVA